MLEGRQLVIATMHQKEKVIAPLFESNLGVKCILPNYIDTDQLGTFTGEKERKEDAYHTALKKCQMGMELTNTDLAIANEGSFGAHPTLFFSPADEELVLLVDKKNNLEIFARELSTSTNFSGTEIYTEDELWKFADEALFPSHGLVLRKSKDDHSEIIKGITDKNELIKSFQYFKTNYKKAFIETDMRALYNPSRMKVIEKATQKLIAKINSKCPECQTPGFGITDAKPGLPCELCYYPTRSILTHVYSCQKCSYKKEVKFPNGKTFEEPTYCDKCNP